jgi:AbiV family abortive infection protein
LGNSSADMSVPVDLLLRGAWFAVEQSGLLLIDAIALFSKNSNSSAAALALLAREELGRGNILFDLWRKAARGGGVSADLVKSSCDDHVEKQRQAQLSITNHLQGPSQLATLLQNRSRAVGTPEYAELDKQVKEIDERMARRRPADRHSTRMKALYVDLNEAGTEWNRPHLFPRTEAFSCLTDAVNDYSLSHNRLSQELLVVTDPELASALSEWDDRPALPLPILQGQSYEL